MRATDKRSRIIFLIVLIAGIGIMLFAWRHLPKTAYNSFASSVNCCMKRSMHVYETYPTATHYYVLPENCSLDFFKRGVTPGMLSGIIINSLFNAIFQPLFLCVLSPQTILTYLLFPFFIYGCIVYFRKLPLMVIFFFGFMIYIGMRDNVVEALIRHRMACDLIYLLIGLAGFTRLITEKS